MTVVVFVAGVLAGILGMVAVRAFTAAVRAGQPLPYPAEHPAGSVAPTGLLIRIRYITDPHAEDYALWDAELEESP